MNMLKSGTAKLLFLELESFSHHLLVSGVFFKNSPFTQVIEVWNNMMDMKFNDNAFYCNEVASALSPLQLL